MPAGVWTCEFCFQPSVFRYFDIVEVKRGPPSVFLSLSLPVSPSHRFSCKNNTDKVRNRTDGMLPWSQKWLKDRVLNLIDSVWLFRCDTHTGKAHTQHTAGPKMKPLRGEQPQRCEKLCPSQKVLQDFMSRGKSCPTLPLPQNMGIYQRTTLQIFRNTVHIFVSAWVEDAYGKNQSNWFLTARRISISGFGTERVAPPLLKLLVQGSSTANFCLHALFVRSTWPRKNLSGIFNSSSEVFSVFNKIFCRGDNEF